ncbi:hypothetical protein R5R35_003523 [Gryllus longicercus]|uniref:3-oxoacyl-[acyl-carrier-protein] synthase, mitochondrial n=2 Tax=Gryllus longicercus TaxID=2509291 RepID=A0AAN9VS49_9ORTH
MKNLAKYTFAVIDVPSFQVFCKRLPLLPDDEMVKCRREHRPLPVGARSFSSVKRRRVVITGLGVVSPLGCGVHHAWKNLLEGGCGIDKLPSEKYSKLPCQIAAVVPRGSKNGQFDQNIFSKSDLRTMSPATMYALTAAQEALSDASWFPDSEFNKQRTGVAVGVGMIDLTDVCETYDALKQSYNRVSPYFVPRILPNMAAGQISIKYGFCGPNHAVSTACATGAHAIGDAFRFIQHGDADVMVCGGAEACISPLSIAAFCRLRALSTKFNERPKESSRPFDEGRDGFVMGEGAAILVMEELSHALKRGVKVHAEILGYGLSGDASHLTAPREDGTGAMLAMSRALEDAHVKPEEIGYINAHATSTPIGDVIECKAIETVFGSKSNLYVSSTKGAHGHLLGAAGNLETVFTVLACETGVMPPTINLDKPAKDLKLNFVIKKPSKWIQTSPRIAVKNAFGFGGTNASLCISQYIES